MREVTIEQAARLVGKHIYAARKDGSVVSGRLLRMDGDMLILEQQGKQASTRAIVPLVLFSLLAIGTSPYAYGYGGYPLPGGGCCYGGGYGGPYGYGGYGSGPYGY